MEISEILGIAGLILTVFGSIITVWVILVSRITTLEVQVKELEKQTARDYERYEHFKSEIREDIAKVYDKIDEIKNLIISLKK